MCSFVQVILDRSFQSRTANACQKRGDDNSERPFEGSLAPLHVPSVKIPLDEQLHRLHIIRQDLEVSLTIRFTQEVYLLRDSGGQNVGRSGSKARETQKKRNELLLAEVEQEVLSTKHGLRSCLIQNVSSRFRVR